MISVKGEGTFSEVLKCKNKTDGTYWACKKMKKYYHNPEQVKELIEIQALRNLTEHENILYLHEVILVKKTGTLNLIFELMDMNLFEYIKNQKAYLKDEKIGNYMTQILKAIEHMHEKNFFHRDIKPENILVKLGKENDNIKLADFGSVRRINTRQPYTEYISTRWYRSPECLLTDGFYSQQMDIWSAGCVMFELCTFRPLFPGSNEIDQIDQIHNILGTPDILLLEKFRRLSRPIRFYFRFRNGTGFKRLMTNCNPDAIDLVMNLCRYDPEKRISAHKALKHPYLNYNTLSIEALARMNQENEKQFEGTQQNQRDERFERKTFESESFLVKKTKQKEPAKDVFNSLLTDANIYKPKFKPKTLTKNSHNSKYVSSKSKKKSKKLSKTNIFDTNSIIGSEYFNDNESNESSHNVKFTHQNLFNKAKSDNAILPELSYFSNSMPLMSMNSTSHLYPRNEKNKKKLPKLSSNSQYFSVPRNQKA